MNDTPFEIGPPVAAPPGPTSRWFVVRGHDVLVSEDDRPGSDVLPMFEAIADLVREPHHVGTRGGVDYWTCGIDAAVEAPDGLRFAGLRPLHPVLGEGLWVAAGRAVQLVAWSETHRFCGRCGEPTHPVPNERAMGCPKCGLHCYPRLSPAVIMIVHRGDEMLLAQGARFGMPMYSALAGFVEPGESLEAAVKREVREEVGLVVDDVTYFSSQPWPFPNSLMVGFYAAHVAGDIVIDPVEIVDAQWFRAEALPNVPSGGLSIAGQLIDGFRAGFRARANPR
jgi:NAD+ diphosphatase